MKGRQASLPSSKLLGDASTLESTEEISIGVPLPSVAAPILLSVMLFCVSLSSYNSLPSETATPRVSTYGRSTSGRR